MKNTRTLVEGALMLSIFVILLLMSIYIPFLMLISQFFLVLPFLVYSAKHPLKYALVLLIGAAMLSFVIGSLAAVPLAFLYGVTGTVMGHGIRKQKSKGSIFISSSIAFLLCVAAIFVVLAQFLSMNLIDEFFAVLRSSADQYIKLMENAGQAPPLEFKTQLEEMIKLFQVLLPSMVGGAAFISVLLLMLINFPIVKRLGVKVPHFGSFGSMQLPRQVLYVYLVVLLASLFLKVEPGSYWYAALLNAAQILQVLLVLQGLSFVFFVSDLKKVPKIIPILAVLFAIVLPIFLSIVRFLGIIDLGFNIRRYFDKKET